MIQLGSRIYFDKVTGEVIQKTYERIGKVAETTVERDIEVFKSLSSRNRETFDFIQLEYGQYKEDFALASSYRVDPATKKLEFLIPEPGAEPVYRRSLTEQVEELEAKYMYDSMMKDMAIEETNNTQAELMYQLMMKGVL
ncbi:hypothetical protein ABER98_01645 [Domibacillus aminovorans]|uniref:hypothetical protein n=1 Tax=Domibacillus aminovorans TaxID=29332 RepID=UPI003D23B605